jgi:ferredoxin-NADP reductase
LAALCSHRQPARRWTSPLALVSVVLAGAPWAFPTLAGVIAGLAVHAVWFAICVRLTPARLSVAVAAVAAPRATPSRPPDGRKPRDCTGAIWRCFRKAAASDLPPAVPKASTSRPVSSGCACGPTRRGALLLHQLAARRPRYRETPIRRQGLVSNALHAWRPGSMLAVNRPAGPFVYPSGDDRPLVLLAGGIGITPLLSMLRHAVRRATRPVTLIYSAREFASLRPRRTADTGQTARRPAAIRRHSRRGAGLSRRITPAAGGDAERATISMICGPQAMIDDLTSTLHQLGVPPDQVRLVVGSAVAASAGRPAAPQTSGCRGRRRLPDAGTPSARTVPVTRGQTLLDAAEAHGLDIPSLCRAGVCGTCRTRVIEGDVRCDGGVLDDADRESGYVLACVASPRSHCVIEVA